MGGSAVRFGMTRLVGGLVLGAIAAPAFACNLPTLPVIPDKDQLGDRAASVSAATSAYFEGIRAYAACIEGDLAAAGGGAAPASVKRTLLARGTAAVAEAEAIQKLYQARIAVGQTATPGSEEALRNLIVGLASGMPDYNAMTPEFARITREQLGAMRTATAAAGEIESIEFAGIDTEGRNVYQVHQKNGTTNARISLDVDGKIEFAFLRPTPSEPRPTARIPPRH
jgi:hypothetical protein